ncbi:uncharacterized protein LOC124145774 isoform X3 [Haliotis rufescens]|uniref:uncharacterized protein LOC124145774 isoform X3 n=1 Tax=Haliotis rufescens TaxID=6454 RepID=UPI00201F910C|nr:uncharacterized protein LOC124145774 isoform X3 [Haliotis rufescens]
MNPNKCRNLCKAFFVAAAVDHTSNPTSSDKIVLLKWDVYQLLEKYLDEQLVIVNYASKERAMKEVDRRLSRSGSTVKTKRRVGIPHKNKLATPNDGDCFEDDTMHNVADSCASSQMPLIKGNLSADHLCRATETETCSKCPKSETTTIRSSNPTGLQHSEASPFTDRFSTSVISVEEMPKEENIKKWLKGVTPLSDSGLGTGHDNETATSSVDSTSYDISRSGPDQDPYQSDADTDSGDSAFTGGYRLLREPRLDADRPVSGISYEGRESPWK